MAKYEKEIIRGFHYEIIGYIISEKDSSDRIIKKTAYDFYMRKLGTYNPKENKTRDFYFRIVGRGDLLSGLIYSEAEKNKKLKK